MRERQCLAEPTLDGWACCLPEGHDGPHAQFHPEYVRRTGEAQVYADDWGPRLTSTFRASSGKPD